MQRRIRDISYVKHHRILENKRYNVMSLDSDRMYNSFACTNVPKLISYTKFKTCFETEHYLTLNLNHIERSIMAQFRCSALPLRVETGRFAGEHASERICKFLIKHVHVLRMILTFF